MEREDFLCGYCRVLDQSRMVTLVTDCGALCEVDCNFESCPYAPNCPIAEKIRAVLT